MSTDKNLSPFNFKYNREVKTYEVDFQHVVHNAIYFYYFEEARIEYLKNLGFSIKGEITISNSQFVVVHNQADYHEPARLGDMLEILVRMSKIGRSSFTYEMEIVREDGRHICSGLTTVVTIDRENGHPKPIPESLRKSVENFEGAALNAAAD